MGKNQAVYTLSQAIRRYGQDFSVARNKLNAFKEPIGKEPVGSFRGLYHVSSSYLDINLTEAAKISTQKRPRLLLLYTDKIKKEDVVQMDGQKYTVTGVDDVGNLHLCIDLPLREA